MTATLPSPTTAASPYALLNDGERQITAGRYSEGSAMVYQAAVAARRAVRRAPGLALRQPTPTPTASFAGWTDGTLPVTFWKPDDYAAHLPMVKKFIDLLAAEK